MNDWAYVSTEKGILQKQSLLYSFTLGQVSEIWELKRIPGIWSFEGDCCCCSPSHFMSQWGFLGCTALTDYNLQLQCKTGQWNARQKTENVPHRSWSFSLLIPFNKQIDTNLKTMKENIEQWKPSLNMLLCQKRLLQLCDLTELG